MNEIMTTIILWLLSFGLLWLLDRAFKLNTPTWLYVGFSLLLWFVLSILWRIYGPR